MSKRKKHIKQNFIFKDPVTILVLLVIYICSLFSVLYLNNIVDLFGMGLFISCFTLCSIPVLIMALSLYSTAKKAVSSRHSKGQTRNALQWAKVSAFGAFCIGFLMAVILFACRVFLCNLLKINSLGNLIFLFLALSLPFLFFDSIMSGSFIGLGFRMPLQSAIVIFTISSLLFGFLFSFLLGKGGYINSALLHNPYIINAFYGAGMSVGIIFGCLISSVWLLLLHKSFCDSIKNGTIEAYGKNSEKVSEQLRSFIISLGYPIIKYVILLCPFILTVFFTCFKNESVEYLDLLHPVNYFAIQFIQIILHFFIPLYFSRLLAVHSEDALKKSMAKQDRYHGGMRLLASVKQFICFILPIIATVAFCTADITEKIIGKSIPDISFWLLFMITFLALSQLFQSFLQGFEKGQLHLFSTLIGLVGIFVYFNFVIKDSINASDPIIALTIGFALICLTDFLFLHKYFVYKKQLLRHIGFPLIAFIAFAGVYFLTLFLKNNIGILLSVMIAFLLACLVQSLVLVLSGSVKEHELNDLPQKKLLLLLGKITGTYE
ncbi:MAG: polysaccharide biosynthesis C-terminal domain-containing protein [Lachnospiraceae bacterium]|nr:polysaccharide biosynthesis C-terminal domain-containing protein [Lachnospiraceae bacterium]